MFDEVKKSISAILYERTTSPLYGSFIFSWSVWNWKIIYLTLFVSEDKMSTNKIDYILNHFWDNHYIFLYPLISTVILITLIPFVSNGAYWLSAKFEKWRIDKKNLIEKNQLLTLDQSVAIREELNSQQNKLETVLSSKNLEIKQFKEIVENKDKEIEILRNGIEEAKRTYKIFEDARKLKEKSPEIEEENAMKDRIVKSESLFNDFNNAQRLIQAGNSLAGNGVSSNFIALLESNGYLDNLGSGRYQFSPKGKKLQSKILEIVPF